MEREASYLTVGAFVLLVIALGFIVASFFVNPAPEVSEDKLLLLQEAIERKRRDADA